MAASPDDVFNAMKNGVAATNGVGNTLQNISGKASFLEVSASTLIKGGGGWVARVSVIVAGSAAGTLYDAATTATAINGTRLAVVANTIGIVDIKLPFTSGLVFTPGSGMIATVSYS